MLQEDNQQLPVWGSPEDVAETAATKSIRCPTVSQAGDAVFLAWHDNPFGYTAPYEHRWGLGLSDEGNTVYWTLDGQVMDTSDVSGYFSSSPESVRAGAFLSVMGVGLFERNTWEMDDLEIYVSP